MRIIAIVALLLVAGITSSSAQSDTSAYCILGPIDNDRGAEPLNKCLPGDTTVIPSRNAAVVARFCDFSKAIVTTNTVVVCVVKGGERRAVFPGDKR